MEERYTRVKELFAATRKRPAEDREVFLERACGGDVELRREVLSLLAYDDGAPTVSAGPRDPTEEARCAGLANGAVLAGRYRITGLLGRGGMGDVYRADDIKLGLTVALKRLPPAAWGDARRRELLADEVRTARAVSHPNVCRVYDIGEADGVDFLIMEYVDGNDLASHLGCVGRLPQDRAAAIAASCAPGWRRSTSRGSCTAMIPPS